MNNLFSEIFGCYYKVITEIVNNAPLTQAEIMEIINKNGFEESAFHLLPMIEKLPFIEIKNGKYYSLLKNKINMPVTNIEKAWLKSISQDERFNLLCENFDKSILDDTEPLYNNEMFKYYDKYSDGDDFENYYYQKHFRKINEAMEKGMPVKIAYQSPKRDRVTVGHYLPLKFEFSPKDDKFRIFNAKIRDGIIIDYICLNMSRVLEVRQSHEICPKNPNIEKHIEKFNSDEPVIVEIYNERNSIERFMVEFSTYNKSTEMNEQDETCVCKLYYHKSDETEILIKLLSFGPTIKILGSERFLELAKQRILRQCKLIKKTNMYLFNGI